MCDSIALGMLFFSDLDKTLVYSGYPDQVCVERSDDKEITYMTPEAIDVFNDLVSQENVVFIPCTLRSYEQTIRISILQSLSRQIFICDNGFSIYVNGSLDKEWDECVQRQLISYPNKVMHQCLCAYYLQNSSEITRIKSNRDAFTTVIFTDHVAANKHFRVICDLIDESLYRIELQGRKLYVIPQFLDKSIAVRYLVARYYNDYIITAGDSSVDELFIKEGTLRIIPKHSSINMEDTIRTSEAGIKAGEIILRIALDCCKNSALIFQG